MTGECSTGEMTDADLGSALKISDGLADEIEDLFSDHEAADCIMALARVFGRAVARHSETSSREQFKMFGDAAVIEMRHEIFLLREQMESPK